MATPKPQPAAQKFDPFLQKIAPWQPAIAKAAKDYGVPPVILEEMIRQESGGNPNATGPDTGKGRGSAKGILQFLDATAKEHGINALDPNQAIPATAKMLQNSYRATGSWEKAVAAHNMGLSRLVKYGDIPPGKGFDQTRHYVKAIFNKVNQRSGAPDRTYSANPQLFAGPGAGTPVDALPSDAEIQKEQLQSAASGAADMLLGNTGGGIQETPNILGGSIAESVAQYGPEFADMAGYGTAPGVSPVNLATGGSAPTSGSPELAIASDLVGAAKKQDTGTGTSDNAESDWDAALSGTYDMPAPTDTGTAPVAPSAQDSEWDSAMSGSLNEDTAASILAPTQFQAQGAAKAGTRDVKELLAGKTAATPIGPYMGDNAAKFASFREGVVPEAAGLARLGSAISSSGMSELAGLINPESILSGEKQGELASGVVDKATEGYDTIKSFFSGKDPSVYKKEREAYSAFEKQAVKDHPFYNLGGSIVQSAPIALATAGLGTPVGFLGKVGLGAATGAGLSAAQTILEDAKAKANDVVISIALGVVTGGVLSGAFASGGVLKNWAGRTKIGQVLKEAFKPSVVAKTAHDAAQAAEKNTIAELNTAAKDTYENTINELQSSVKDVAKATTPEQVATKMAAAFKTAHEKLSGAFAHAREVFNKSTPVLSKDIATEAEQIIKDAALKSAGVSTTENLSTAQVIALLRNRATQGANEFIDALKKFYVPKGKAIQLSGGALLDAYEALSTKGVGDRIGIIKAARQQLADILEQNGGKPILEAKKLFSETIDHLRGMESAYGDVPEKILEKWQTASQLNGYLKQIGGQFPQAKQAISEALSAKFAGLKTTQNFARFLNNYPKKDLAKIVGQELADKMHDLATKMVNIKPPVNQIFKATPFVEPAKSAAYKAISETLAPGLGRAALSSTGLKVRENSK